jgi:hypothetical protein
LIAHRISSIEQLPYDINLYEPKGITPQLKVGLDRIIKPGQENAVSQMILFISYDLIKYPLKSLEQNFSVKIQANF